MGQEEEEEEKNHPKTSFKSLTANLLSTKNNRAHRGTGLDQPQIPTTPPQHTERQIKTQAAEARKQSRDVERRQLLCTTFTKTVIYYESFISCSAAARWLTR